jgi:hypothetical protein
MKARALGSKVEAGALRSGREARALGFWDGGWAFEGG